MRLVFVIAILTLSLASCGGNSFDRESASIQRVMSGEAHLVSRADPKRNGYTTEASWQYEISMGAKDAKEAFRGQVAKEYELVRDDELGLSYAKFDGHDSFHLTLAFQSREENSTAAGVVLTSTSD